MRARGQDLDGAGARHLASVCADVEGRLYEAEHPPNGGHARRRGDQDGAAMTLLVPAVLPSSLVGGDSLFCSRSRAVQKRRERGRVVALGFNGGSERQVLFIWEPRATISFG
jgi:hypothetical protein